MPEGPEGNVSTANPPDIVDGTIAALTPEAVRNTPEYQELLRQNRQLARENGAAKRIADEARAAAERERLAAEARQQADLEAQLTSTLGEDGLAAYNEIAVLSQTNPRAAALKMAELIKQSKAQSQGSETTPSATATPPQPTPGGSQMSSQTPPPPRGLDAGAPLGGAPNTPDQFLQIADDLEKTFQSQVARNNDPNLRNRVTMRDRAEGMIAYIGSAVLRAGARPKG